MGYQTEKTLKELGDKVSDSDRKDIESKLETLKKAAESDDADAIRKATEDLQNAFNAISQQLYQQEQQAPQPDMGNMGGAAPADADDDIIKGEVSEE